MIWKLRPQLASQRQAWHLSWQGMAAVRWPCSRQLVNSSSTCVAWWRLGSIWTVSHKPGRPWQVCLDKRLSLHLDHASVYVCVCVCVLAWVGAFMRAPMGAWIGLAVLTT